MRRLIIILFCSSYFFANAQISADSVISISKKVADWQINEWESKGMRWQKWDWTNAVCYTGLFELSKVSNDKKYIEFLLRTGQAANWKCGPNRSYADEYCVAQMYCKMYGLYRDNDMIYHFKTIADRLLEVPHTESLAWNNKIFLREWAWSDALFMGPPSFACLYKATGKIEYFDFANALWWKTTAYLFDTSENLFFRDSRFFDKKEANGEKVFWSRGNGWVVAGLVSMLSKMPNQYTDENKYVELFKKVTKKIASLQHSDGSWHTSLLDSVSYKQMESSGTAFNCYAMAWGINNGLLSYEEYLPVVEKAWKALQKCVHPDGKLGYVQQIGDKPGHVYYDDTEVYGVGAFLLAGCEMSKLATFH